MGNGCPAAPALRGQRGTSLSLPSGQARWVADTCVAPGAPGTGTAGTCAPVARCRRGSAARTRRRGLLVAAGQAGCRKRRSTGPIVRDRRSTAHPRARRRHRGSWCSRPPGRRLARPWARALPPSGAAAAGGVRGAEDNRDPIDPHLPASWHEREHRPGQPEPQPLPFTLTLTLAIGHEALPGVREFVPDIEVVASVAGQVPPRARVRGAAEQLPAFARGVVDAEHGVVDRVEGEVVVLRRQFDAPAAHRAHVLERQVARVVEVQLEQPRVVLTGRGGDRLARVVLADRARVVRAKLVLAPSASSPQSSQHGSGGQQHSCAGGRSTGSMRVVLPSRVSRQCTPV